MIPISPLQLRQHFFTLISVRANQNGSAKGEASLEPSISFEKHKDNSNQWLLVLRVKLESLKPDNKFLYDAEIEVHGRFEINNSFTKDDRDKIAVINGLSILYSAIREMILNITARSPHGAFYLPTLNFAAIIGEQFNNTKPS